MKLISSYKILAVEQQVEMEGNPIRRTISGGYIEKSGTLWCVRSNNPADRNFGCYSSREEAESHLRTLHAGGPGSGCNPEVAKCGRKGEPDAPTIMWEPESKKVAPFMRLTLNDHSFPYLFNSDNTSWGWDKDRKTLTITQFYDPVGGLSHKEIYEVPVDAVQEWQPATKQRPDARQTMNAAGLRKYRKLNAYGTSEGVEKEWESREHDTGDVWDSVRIARLAELIKQGQRTPAETKEMIGLKRHFNMKAVSQFGQTGWQYGQRTMGRETGYIPQRTVAGFPAPRPGGGGRGMAREVRPSSPLGHTAKRTVGSRPHPMHTKIVRPANFGHVPKISVPKPKFLGPKASPMGRAPKASPMGRAPQLQGFADWGEPMAGGMSHAHIEPVTWFRPPSLTKREKPGEDHRIPTDDPKETNNKFGDVSKRNSKDTQEMRYKLLKRSSPGGLPAQIPAHTTALEPHQAFYMPLSQIFSSARPKYRKLLKGSNFTTYARRGCI